MRGRSACRRTWVTDLACRCGGQGAARMDCNCAARHCFIMKRCAAPRPAACPPGTWRPRPRTAGGPARAPARPQAAGRRCRCQGRSAGPCPTAASSCGRARRAGEVHGRAAARQRRRAEAAAAAAGGGGGRGWASHLATRLLVSLASRSCCVARGLLLLGKAGFERERGPLLRRKWLSTRANIISGVVQLALLLPRGLTVPVPRGFAIAVLAVSSLRGFAYCLGDAYLAFATVYPSSRGEQGV